MSFQSFELRVSVVKVVILADHEPSPGPNDWKPDIIISIHRKMGLMIFDGNAAGSEVLL